MTGTQSTPQPFNFGVDLPGSRSAPILPRYIATRLIQAAFLIFGIVVAVFFLLRFLGGNPAKAEAGTYIGTDPQVLKAYERQMGLNLAIPAQFWHYISGVVRGNFGLSFRFGQSVTSLIFPALSKTALLVALALVLSLTGSTVLGALSAARPSGVIDRVAGALATTGQSVPMFYVGVLLDYIFAARLHLLPALGSPTGLGLILPAITVAFAVFPEQLRLVRVSMSETLVQDFVYFERALGLPQWRIMLQFALRNALLPLLTVLGLELGYLLSGAIAAEVVFNYPGIGLLAYQAMLSRDFPLLEGVTIVASSIFVLANLGIDLLYPLVDPWVRLGSVAK